MRPSSLRVLRSQSLLRSTRGRRLPRCLRESNSLSRGAEPFSTIASQYSWWRGTQEPVTKTGGRMASNDEYAPSELRLPQTSKEVPLTRRVHILGLGSIGTFVAHSLANLPNPPPISLCLHRPDIFKDFREKRRLLRLVNKDQGINDEQTGFDVDVFEPGEDDVAYWRFEPHEDFNGEYKKELEDTRIHEEIMDSGETMIHNLIVCVKSHVTVSSLLRIRHRLNEKSTIVFLQNGMGQIDELNEQVFDDPSSRPTYMLGIVSHGVYMTEKFTVIQAGQGTTALAIVRDTDKFPIPSKQGPPPSSLSETERKRLYPSEEDLYSNISSRYMLRTLTRSTILACAAFPYLDLMQLQLEKLAMNSVINPMTAILGITNGGILNNNSLGRVARMLLAEISLVFRSLPELDALPNVRMRFSPERLETLVISIARRTAKNNSSMRQDVRKGYKTEIEYINGYVIKRGEVLGIKCVLNYMMMHLVNGKTLNQMQHEEYAGLPFAVPAVGGPQVTEGIEPAVKGDEKSVLREARAGKSAHELPSEEPEQTQNGDADLYAGSSMSALEQAADARESEKRSPKR